MGCKVALGCRRRPLASRLVALCKLLLRSVVPNQLCQSLAPIILPPICCLLAVLDDDELDKTAAYGSNTDPVFPTLTSKRRRHGEKPQCRVPGCDAELSSNFHAKYRICEIRGQHGLDGWAGPLHSRPSPV